MSHTCICECLAMYKVSMILKIIENSIDLWKMTWSQNSLLKWLLSAAYSKVAHYFPSYLWLIGWIPAYNRYIFIHFLFVSALFLEIYFFTEIGQLKVVSLSHMGIAIRKQKYQNHCLENIQKCICKIASNDELLRKSLKHLQTLEKYQVEEVLCQSKNFFVLCHR